MALARRSHARFRSPLMPLQRPTYRLIDLLKVIAAQCIVLHHLALYGPLSDAMALAAPELAEWFYDYARMAVQVFLVVAGYLAARSLGSGALPAPVLVRNLWQRYERLVLPFLAAMVITVLVSALARPHLDGDLVPAAPGLLQWLAHASLLHSVLGVDSISAGVWYVAIDFQLYVLFALLVWLARGRLWVRGLLVAGLTVASLTWFNLDAEYDVWALYFFGAYGLGALAWRAGAYTPDTGRARALYFVTLLVGLGSLALEFRERIALAIGVSSLLLAFGSAQMHLPRRLDRWVRQLSNSSYALFLVHFSVLLLVNAVWGTWGPQDHDWAPVFVLAAWGLSLLLSHLFHVHVEQRIAVWRAGRLPVAALVTK
jgi:peptidoglycan/LPS O-acetylase OafA/YrhL